MTGGLELNANRSKFERRDYRPISRIIGTGGQNAALCIVVAARPGTEH
jgi:hypothetical protein